MTPVDVVLERETANDEQAVVVAIHVHSGQAVAAEQAMFEIENSKATQDVVAPQDGIVIHNLAVGQAVGFGVAIARIVSPDTPAAAPAIVADADPRAPPVRAGDRLAEPHVSRAAAILLAEYGLSGADIEADFVTARAVRAAAGGRAASDAKAPVDSACSPAPSAVGQPVGTRKLAEIDALRDGAGGTMLSVLGTTIGPLAPGRRPDDLLAGRITDIVIYEAARLLRKYPRLNAAYRDGHVLVHDAVHAGLAIDGGGRLVVYGIEHADRVALPDLSAVIADAVARYMANALTAAELSRATFTVTDLSDGHLDFVLPLLPRGQSCIIGVTRSDDSGFRLFAGFDHRVTEGREVAAFLGELRARVVSFGAAAAATSAAMLSCDFCARSLTEAVVKGKDKGLLRITGRDGREALCCASCWHGW